MCIRDQEYSDQEEVTALQDEGEPAPLVDHDIVVNARNVQVAAHTPLHDEDHDQVEAQQSTRDEQQLMNVQPLNQILGEQSATRGACGLSEADDREETFPLIGRVDVCLLYTSDAADERSSV